MDSQDASARISVSDGECIFHIPRVRSVQALGGVITFDGSTKEMVAQQINKGKWALYAEHKIFKSKHVYLKRKLRHLTSIVYSVILNSCFA